MIKGTKAATFIKILSQIPLNKRNNVEEVTLDISANMDLIV